MTTQTRRRIAAGCYIAYTAVTLYWMVSYTALGRILGDLQLAWFGSYWPVLSLLALHIPAIILMRVLTRTGPIDPIDVAEKSLASEWMQDLFVPMIIIGVGAFIVGGVLWGHAMSPDLGHLNVDSLPNPSRGTFYAEITGQLDQNGLAVQKGGESAMVYQPLRSSPADRGSAHAIVEVQENEIATTVQRSGAGDSMRLRGFFDHHLDGFVRAGLKQRGVEVAEDCWVIHTRVSPGRARTAMIAILAIVLGIASVRLYQNRRARSAA